MVIDLRTEGEDRGMDEEAVVEALGMRYELLPIGRGSITFENAQALDALISESDGPVLVHCGSSNRVGALMTLRQSLNGADDESALEYGRDAGLRSLESSVIKVLDQKREQDD
jgi:uncharacterized protein (TIGR01244 family)